MTVARDIIESFVTKAFPTDSSVARIAYDTSFVDSGIMDSMRVLELVEFLEGQFGIRVEDYELVPENLDSIRNICGYLEAKGVPAIQS
jgi:acyl carrier protein